MALKVIHLDDDLTTLERFAQMLSSSTFSDFSEVKTESFDNSSAFKSALASKKPFDLLLIDVELSADESGVDIARFARKELPHAVILMVSSTKDNRIIRDCLKAGADDFVSKNADASEIVIRIEGALEEKKLHKNKLNSSDIKNFAGDTISEISLRVPAILKSAVNCVYIDGESGTGKEVVASLFASYLPKSMPFIKINCGAISSSLLMSELFGHTKGSFTGATSDKIGLLESSHGGWIFLDEIATLPNDAQVALLRAIDNQAIRRVGANHEIPIQFRVISATNESLDDLVRQGKFRMDLWQRLRETHITLPPLRKRKKEIPDLIDLFLSSMRGGPYQLAPTVKDALIGYDWSEGNIRELRNVLRAMTEKSVQGLLTPKSIPDRIWDHLDQKNHALRRSTDQGNQAYEKQILIQWQKSRPTFDQLEQLLFLEVLKQEFKENGPLSLRIIGSALGISKSTISTKLRGLVDDKLMTQEDLNKLLKSGGS